MTPAVNWTFRAALRRVIDGDTVEMTIDTGFGQTVDLAPFGEP